MLKGVYFFCKQSLSKQTSKPTENMPFTEESHSWFHFVRKNNANFLELKLKNEYPYPCITIYRDCVLKHREP